MKKIFTLFLFSMITFNAIHAKITWNLSNDGTLTISGSDMPDYKENVNDRVPWYYRRDEIKKIVIENGVSNIGELAFYNCSNLTNITIPNSVTRIGKYAFMGCLNLTSITIPNSVTSIGEEAFNDCSSLTSVYITDLIAWCKITFYTNRANPLYYATHLYINGKEADNLVIPNEITKIEDYSFYNCYSLTSITIPNSVTSIGNNAFSGCEGIKEIYSWNNTPPSAYRNSFTSMNTIHAKVFVPEGAVDAYKYSLGWMNFMNIYEMEYSPVHSEAEPITVSDATPTVTKGYYKENTITYVREGAAICKDNYASFCLPFAVDPADAQFKAVYVPVGIALYNTETNTLRIGFYKSNEIIPAGTPFLAKLAVDDKVEIKNALPVNYDSNEPIVKTKVIRTFDFYERSGIMSENDNYSINFTGTYKKISPANACTFNIDGSAGPSANVFPFRAYIALTKNSTNAKIIASFDEYVETTGIKELLISNDKSPVYDLNGRVVNEKSQKSGIYIKNGKKYVK